MSASDEMRNFTAEILAELEERVKNEAHFSPYDSPEQQYVEEPSVSSGAEPAAQTNLGVASEQPPLDENPYVAQAIMARLKTFVRPGVPLEAIIETYTSQQR